VGAAFTAPTRQARLKATRLCLQNSGDTAGPRDSVVGYGARLFAEERRLSRGHVYCGVAGIAERTTEAA
jgi:hypothetical protein